MKETFPSSRATTQRGFINIIVLIVIGLFILSYLDIFKIEEHVRGDQIKAVFTSFVAWIKGLFN